MRTGYGNEWVQRANMGLGIISAVILLVLFFTFSSWYTIDEGERGVLLRNGAVKQISEPGLHFKLPIFESVVKISTQSRKLSLEKVESYSSDQQPADINISINYHINPSEVTEVYAAYGGENGIVERLIVPKVLQEGKVVFGGFTAARSIQERGLLNTEFFNKISNSIKGPVVIEGIQIENIKFSPAYEQSVEQRMLAEVEVQKVEQNAKREKEQAKIVITKANAEADARIAQAKAEAEAIKTKGDADAYAAEVKGKAEASAIAAKGLALRDNPSMINLIAAERWSGKLPTHMIPSGSLPFVNLNARGQ